MSAAGEAGDSGSAGTTPEPLIDVHAHFLHDRCGRSDWREVNAARLDAGRKIGVSFHVASILGSWGSTSPTYMPSPEDVSYGNSRMLSLQGAIPDLVRSYVMVNPNDMANAVEEIDRGISAGAIGVKLAASRRADHPLVDEIARLAARHGVPVLQHIWQNRGREWPGQEASDGIELVRLAARHPSVNFILAHIGGGGDYAHTFAAVRGQENVFLDISGSGVDRGMLDDAVSSVGATRILWGSDLTMETGLAKLRALDHIGIGSAGISAIRWRNAVSIFPPGSFPGVPGKAA